MKRLWILALVAIGITSTALAYNFQPQKFVECIGGQRAGQSSCVTPPLHTATDAHTDCDATTDGVISLATADLDCANTGNMLVSAWNQVSVEVHWTRSAGSAVKMQCDEAETPGTGWAVRTKLDSDGASTVRTWTHTQAFSGNWKWNWDINTKWLRCRFWVVGGTSSDKVKAYFRLASEVKQ